MCKVIEVTGFSMSQQVPGAGTATITVLVRSGASDDDPRIEHHTIVNDIWDLYSVPDNAWRDAVVTIDDESRTLDLIPE